MTEIQIAREPIELFKALKLSNLVASGAEAKAVISEGYVQVNGSVEQQKRKKIYAGDMIEFADTQITVRLEAEETVA